MDHRGTDLVRDLCIYTAGFATHMPKNQDKPAQPTKQSCRVMAKTPDSYSKQGCQVAPLWNACSLHLFSVLTPRKEGYGRLQFLLRIWGKQCINLIDLLHISPRGGQKNTADNMSSRAVSMVIYQSSKSRLTIAAEVSEVCRNKWHWDAAGCRLYKAWFPTVHDVHEYEELGLYIHTFGLGGGWQSTLRTPGVP